MKILNRFNSNVIFEFECNSMKECVQEAVKQKVSLKGADLKKANLYEANLQEADLRWANLQEANLRGANLQEANLRWANLQEADLRWANLWGEKITKNPVYINAGLKWQVWIIDKKIKIGCQIHTTLAWSKFTDEQISKMDSEALEFWKKWKEPILAMAREHQKVQEQI